MKDEQITVPDAIPDAVPLYVMPEGGFATGPGLEALAHVLGVMRRPGRRLWYTLWLMRGPAETDAALRARAQAALMRAVREQ